METQLVIWKSAKVLFCKVVWKWPWTGLVHWVCLDGQPNHKYTKSPSEWTKLYYSNYCTTDCIQPTFNLLISLNQKSPKYHWNVVCTDIQKGLVICFQKQTGHLECQEFSQWLADLCGRLVWWIETEGWSMRIYLFGSLAQKLPLMQQTIGMLTLTSCMIQWCSSHRNHTTSC